MHSISTAVSASAAVSTGVIARPQGFDMYMECSFGKNQEIEVPPPNRALDISQG